MTQTPAPRRKIIFMGTPDFAVQALAALYAAGHDILRVYTQPPRPAGRGHKLHKSPVHVWAEDHGLAVHTPHSLKKDAAARADFLSLKADVAVVAAYGLILPQDILDTPVHGCLNIHASLLPRWRGAAPIQRAIMAGDDKSGVCIMQMEAGLDTGPVLLRGETPITAITTAQSLHDSLAALGATLAVAALDALGQMTATAQDDTQATYARMLDKNDGRIDWSMTAADIAQHIRGVTPWPGAWCMAGGKRLKILSAAIAQDGGAGKQGGEKQTGEILSRDMVIACGTGHIRLLSVQPENRAAMDAASFMNGGQVATGDILS